MAQSSKNPAQQINTPEPLVICILQKADNIAVYKEKYPGINFFRFGTSNQGVFSNTAELKSGYNNKQQVIVLHVNQVENQENILEQLKASKAGNTQLCQQKNGLQFYQPAGYALHSSTFNFLLENNAFDCHNPLLRIQNILNSSQVKYNKIETKGKCRKQAGNGIFNQIKFRFAWCFVLPFKNKLNSPTGEHVLYRGIFALLMVAMLAALTIMSRYAGISGDEEKHYQHAQYVYNFFTSLGEDKKALDPQNGHLLEYYGQSFDNFTYFITETFNIENYYEFRHFMNAITGWLTILFVGLIAALLSGWRASIIAAFLLFISPRFLGHALNNPVDIPFAMGCTMALYYIIKFNKNFPFIPFRTVFLLAVGLGVAVSIRIGGLLFVVMTVFFTGLYFLQKNGLKGLYHVKHRPQLYRLIAFVGSASILGYLFGLILWPYGLVNPITNPLNALTEMTDIGNALRQVFDGKIVWSDNVPWYYTIKYMSITIPMVIFIGFILFAVFIISISKKITFFNIFLLLFTFIFPIVYIIIKESNIYGGWRHLNFIYGAIIVSSALGFTQILTYIKTKWNFAILVAILLGLSFHPIKHIVKNFPHHYVYYNEPYGGVKKAYAQYEMDYYYHSMRASALWLIDKAKQEGYTEEKPMVVASNHSTLTKYYMRHYPNMRVNYVRYYDRGESDWDYAVIANSYLSPYQLKKKIWPPKNTVHTIDVDKKPICAILKREDRNDLLGYKQMKAGNYPLAVSFLKKSVQYDPNYENSWLNLSECYLNMGNIKDALEATNKCLTVYKNYDKALYNMGMAYLKAQKPDYAISAFNQTLKANYKYTHVYYLLGVAYYYKQDATNALKQLELAIGYNPNHGPAYQLLSGIYAAQGNKELAQHYANKAKALGN